MHCTHRLLSELGRILCKRHIIFLRSTGLYRERRDIRTAKQMWLAATLPLPYCKTKQQRQPWTFSPAPLRPDISFCHEAYSKYEPPCGCTSHRTRAQSWRSSLSTSHFVDGILANRHLFVLLSLISWELFSLFLSIWHSMFKFKTLAKYGFGPGHIW